MQKKIGRPYSGSSRKDIRYTIRFNKEEHKDVTKKAQKKGLSIAEYLRELVLKDR